MIAPQQWVPEALAGLKKEFGPRLLYLGLQGSYRRGEATEASDIDLVTILDTVSLDDLDKYRGVVRSLPEGETVCGFISGRAEFTRWPRHELFPLKMDSADHYGRLDDFLPPISRADIREGARIGASALTHFLTHSYIYADFKNRPAILKDSYKAAYFVIQVATYLAGGPYCASKKELLRHLEGTEKEIIAAGLNLPAWLAGHSEKEGFDMLLAWCKETLTQDWP